MKLLISAYACEPGRGAEPGVGWNIARELASRHELWIITRTNNRCVIEASGESWAKDVHWVYVDPPRWLTFWKRGMRGLRIFYTLWQWAAYRRAKRLVKEVDFDLVHHVTFGKFWIPSPLASLDIPFVFGPVGGGESAPSELLAGFGLKTRIVEKARELISKAVPRLPVIRNWYRGTAWTFAATSQTSDMMSAAGVKRMSVLRQSGIGHDEVERFAQMGPRVIRKGKELVLWRRRWTGGKSRA